MGWWKMNWVRLVEGRALFFLSLFFTLSLEQSYALTYAIALEFVDGTFRRRALAFVAFFTSISAESIGRKKIKALFVIVASFSTTRNT